MVDDAVSPMLWATPRSLRLVAPRALIRRLSTRETETLIVHELAHLRRGDHRIRYLELAATVLFWWHPASWWASRQLRRAEEECCDALVAETLPDDRRAYADCLLKTLQYLARAGRAPYALERGALATGAGEVRDLQRRLTMILKRQSSRSLSMPSRAVLTVAALALLAVFPTLAGSGDAPLITQVDPGFSGQAMDFDVQGASLLSVLEEIASKTSLNIVVDPRVDVQAPVTSRFQAIPWDQILATVIREQSLSYLVEGNVIWVGDGVAVERKVQYQGEPITLELAGADLRKTLEGLADRAKLELEMGSQTSTSR